MDEPASTRLVDAGMLARLTRQALRSRMPMTGNVSGLHQSPHRGSSVEFAEYRKYAAGDDLRRLDWRVYGRTDRFYIREFEADTNLRCYLVVDGSASMAFGEGAETKMGVARRLAAALAYLLVRQGDAAGLLAVGKDAVCDVPPRRAPSHLQVINRRLAALEPSGETGLAAALHRLAERARARALVAVISDLFCDVEALVKAFQHLRFQKHDLAVFHLLDRRELEFDFDRPMRFVDMEWPGSVLAEPAAVRRQYLDALDRYLVRLQSGCHQLQADYRRVILGESIERTLADFLVERAQAR